MRDIIVPSVRKTTLRSPTPTSNNSNTNNNDHSTMWRSREIFAGDMLGCYMSDYPQDYGGSKSSSNGDLNALSDNFGSKKSVLNKLNSSTSSLGASGSGSTASAFSSTSEKHSSSSQMMKSSSSSTSSSVSKKAQLLHSLTSSQELKQQQQQQTTQQQQENRNYSRSMSLSSSSSSSDQRVKMLSTNNRGFSVDDVLTEEDPDGNITIRENSPQELRFEQKRMASSSHCKVQSDGFTAEKSAVSNKELKRVQTGEVSYEERQANSSVKARMEGEGFSAEKMSASHQEQKQLKSGDSVQQQQRKAMHTSAMKMSTDEFSAEKSAVSKQEERQMFSSTGMVHQERNMSSSSKMAYSSKATKSSLSSCQNVQQIEYNNMSSTTSSSSLVGSPIISSLDGFALNSQRLAITQGFEEDLELLCGSSASSQDNHRVMTRIRQRMEMCVEKLKTANDDEAKALLGSINDMIRKAWAVPTVGYDIGFSMCNILRNNGGLDIIIGNLGSEDDELEFHSAQVLEQCLSTENRAYVVEKGLDRVIRVACSCSTRNSVNHSRIGTGILAHMFKHSETTCSDVIRLGGLKAILYDCRTSDIETLRHCAAALANLSLYGGPENQQAMIKSKAPVWLFPLAFNLDDNIKYYACLAIAALVANKEIEAAVLQSGTLDLVEPFVSSHNPEEFATSSVAHVHGQSKNWLLRLVPALNSKREEARSLAAFHFAMEAGIKKKQGNTSIFLEIGAVEALKKVASSPNAIASKYAAQALQLIGEEVPHKLSQQVPLWTVEDVREWVKQTGFSHYSQQFMNSRVDGDLLLQLTEEMLKEDIGIKNGILRRRFLRELSSLKRMADYSSCDNTNLNHMLQLLGPDFCQYTYPMLQCGVDRDNIRFMSEFQLERECGIENSIHRLRIGQAIEGLVTSCIEEEDSTTVTKSLDVFVSYRRSNGSQLASLLKVHLQLRGFSVFIDVERLEAGKFDNNLLNSIQQAKHFLLVLTPNALDRCSGDTECKDWVHREIVEALQSQCNIIPILDNFQWPEAESLPEDMRAISYFNGVRWIHDYQDACVDKLERFMRGEMNVRSDGPLGRYVGMGGPGTPGTPSMTMSRAPNYQRSASNDSTKGGSTCSDKETNGNSNGHPKPIIEHPH